MADISGLNLVAPDRIEGPYQEQGEYTPPPPAGVYVVQAPDTIVFSGDKNGKLQCKNLKLRIVDGQEGAGYTIFAYLGTATSKFRNGNTACDYLRAHGIDIVPEENQQYADLIESTQGRTFQVSADWEFYNSDTDETIKGMDKAPLNPDGTRSFRLKDPKTGKELLANLRVKRFVSIVNQVQA